MKRNHYLIAYTDELGFAFSDTEPWIHPSHPQYKKEILREQRFLLDKVKVTSTVIFKVDPDNVPEDITWDFVNKNKAYFQHG